MRGGTTKLTSTQKLINSVPSADYAVVAICQMDRSPQSKLFFIFS